MPRRGNFSVLLDESSPTREEVEQVSPPTKQMQKMKIGPATVPELKKPLSSEGRKMIPVETNVYRMVIKPKIIFRYDVAMSLHTMNGHVVDLLFKGNNNADITNRPKLCMSLMRIALDSHNIVSDGEFVIHDGAACLYSTQDLSEKLRVHSSILQIPLEDLPAAVGGQHIHVQNAKYFAVEITTCQEQKTLNTADYVDAQTNREFDHLDRTFKQFMDLLTSQDALLEERFMSMRGGKLYLAEGPHQDLRCGHERVKGVDKGIKFVSKGNGVIPALVIDSKQGDFFKEQCLKLSIKELLSNMGHRGQDFPFQTEMKYLNGEEKRMYNKYWTAANQFVRGLQMERIGSETRQSNFTAIGITREPISQVQENVERSEAKQPVLARFRGLQLDTKWPAVVFRGVEVQSGLQVAFHYPMELLHVKAGQRVPIAKQIADPTGAVGPVQRFDDIHNMLEVLNLDKGGKNNELMKGFGVTIEENPIVTEALIREKPQVKYQGQTARIEHEGNWRSGNMKFLVAAEISTVYVLGGREDTVNSVIDSLKGAARQRGLKIDNWEAVHFYERNSRDSYKRLEVLFEEYRTGKEKATKPMVILVDDDRLNTHGILKLAERRYQVRTMHMLPKTANALFRSRVTCDNIIKKLNEKCGGVNHTVSPDKYGKNDWVQSTMFIGYDVSHPTGESRDQKMNRAPPKTPSTIGFAFNGGKDMSAFLGDFHYQQPLQEKVDSSILTARTKWMLDVFMKNRRCAPKAVYIIRDGVSEGQYAMVMKEELKAIKAAFTDYRNAEKIQNMPKFNLYVSTKRHNVRMVQLNNKENLPAGSFVSRDITRNDVPEFFMLAHKVIKGTGKAPSIQCIVDENKTTLEQDESLFHALAYCHKIVDSPLSNAEPVYMADEYAKRGKNLFNAYSEHHTFPLLTEKGEYREEPIDFEALTGRLAYWRTSLEEYRVNA